VPRKAKHQSQADRERGDLRGPTDVQPIVVEDLRGQEMDVESPGWLGKGLEGPRMSSRNRKARGPGPSKAPKLGNGLRVEPQEINKMSR
jgi:hypothetical protein